MRLRNTNDSVTVYIATMISSEVLENYVYLLLKQGSMYFENNPKQ